MELGGCPANIEELARKSFEKVEKVPDREGLTGWPEGPNSCFRQGAWHFFGRQQDWLNMESDCWPITDGPEWMDYIERDWNQAKKEGKFFMGDLLPGGNGYAEHMSGNAVWSWQTPNFSAKTVQAVNAAYDIVDPGPIVANMQRTPLIQDIFTHPPGLVPTFKDFESLAIIRPSAVLFHRNKDFTLIRRIREKKRGLSIQPIMQSVPHRGVIHTYYDPALPNQEWMLQKWADAWRDAGFVTKVLSLKEAGTHSNFQQFDEYFRSLPTVNPIEYELACWRRWIAMVQVGGGVLVDYDVLPFGFSMEQLTKIKAGPLPTILADKNPCPCAVVGSAEQFNSALAWFMENRNKCVKVENGREHASDQTAVQSGDPWQAEDICFQYGREGWHRATLVHFAHSSCAGRPREQAIPAAEKLREKLLSNASELVCQDVKLACKDIIEQAKPETWIDGIRTRIEHLKTQAGVNENNRQRVMAELKKVGLIPGGLKYGIKKSPIKKRTKRQLAKV